jgi:hypothetical protein
MFCPQCGETAQDDQLKFCKSCGANLFAVRKAMTTRETQEKFDWNKTWVTEMFLTQGEKNRRNEELERQRGITPEVKRLREMKAGVITASVGVGVALFLYILMLGIVEGGKVAPAAVPILSKLWAVGVIPFFVGVGLLLSGMLGKKAPQFPVELGGEKNEAQKALPYGEGPALLQPGVSVTEGTTRHMSTPGEVKSANGG